MTAISVNDTDLNSQLEIVVDAFIDLQDEAAVAAQLNCAQKLVHEILLRNHEILLRKLKLRLLQLGPIAVKTLEKAMANTGAGQNALNAAKTVLDRIGLVPPKAADPDQRKGLEAMSRDELLSVIQAAERQLGDRAAPVAPVIGAQASEILD